VCSLHGTLTGLAQAPGALWICKYTASGRMALRDITCSVYVYTRHVLILTVALWEVDIGERVKKNIRGRRNENKRTVARLQLLLVPGDRHDES
jgi:hypothetical protein